MSICHCLALPHLPWTCGVPSPAVTWQPGPVPVLSVSYQIRPCRPLPMLCAHCSGVRGWWEQGRKLNSCCLCLHTGFDIKRCGAFDCWKTVKSCSFKPKPMFAGSELYNGFFTLGVQHFMWFFLYSFFFLIISRLQQVVYKRNHIIKAQVSNFFSFFQMQRRSLNSAEAQTDKYACCDLWLQSEKWLDGGTAAERGNQVWHLRTHARLFFKQQQTLSLMLGKDCGFN